jgi:hypothetical protein
LNSVGLAPITETQGRIMTSFVRLFVFLLLLPSAFVSAQISIRYFPSHPPKDGSIPQVCLDEGSVLRTELQRFPHPSKWTFIVACDETSWAAVERHVDWSNVPGKVLGLTDIDNGITYLRGWSLIHPFDGTEEACPEHVIAHELAHITCTPRMRAGLKTRLWIGSRRLVSSRSSGRSEVRDEDHHHQCRCFPRLGTGSDCEREVAEMG